MTTEEIKESTRKRRRLEAKQEVQAAATSGDTTDRISLEKMSSILAEQLLECEPTERVLFDSISVPPERVAFADSIEDAFVVARRGEEVIYYEEVEDGFNTSRLDVDGRIAEHWYNQDELRWVLYAWARS